MYILAAGIILWLVYYILVKPIPLWEQVYCDIEELKEIREESMDYIEDYLQDTYNLSEREARLCVNNYGNESWFQIQSFLQD